jgi:hypothetical protein
MRMRVDCFVWTGLTASLCPIGTAENGYSRDEAFLKFAKKLVEQSTTDNAPSCQIKGEVIFSAGCACDLITSSRGRVHWGWDHVEARN